MAKIYYTVELQTGYSFLCMHEDKFTVSADGRSLLIQGQEAYDLVSVLYLLMDKAYHLDANREKCVRGKYVATISRPYFVQT